MSIVYEGILELHPGAINSIPSRSHLEIGRVLMHSLVYYCNASPSAFHCWSFCLIYASYLFDVSALKKFHFIHSGLDIT